MARTKITAKYTPSDNEDDSSDVIYLSSGNEDDSRAVIYLDCPFDEEDDAKAFGAQFDGSSKLWFVPPNHYKDIWLFNRWRPADRLYLDCPLEEKDDAKKAGAKWDPVVKSWYVFKASNLVQHWLPFYGDNDDVNSAHSPPKKKKAPSTSTKRGNAQDAATLRINDKMIVGQLQEECRTRGISGYSGKNKDYLLEQLGIGTVWLSMATKNKKGKEGAKVKKMDSGTATPVTQDNMEAPAEQDTATKAKATTSAAKAKAPKTPSMSAAKGKATLTGKATHKDTKPKVSAPRAKPNASPGEGSIWTTAPAEADPKNSTTKGKQATKKRPPKPDPPTDSSTVGVGKNTTTPGIAASNSKIPNISTVAGKNAESQTGLLTAKNQPKAKKLEKLEPDVAVARKRRAEGQPAATKKVKKDLKYDQERRAIWQWLAPSPSVKKEERTNT